MKGGLLLLPVGALAAIMIGGAHPPEQPGSVSVAQQAAGPPPAKLLWPVRGAVLTQPFGCTDVLFEPRASFCASGHFHSGIDLASRLGTPLHAAAAGVAQVANRPGGYGLYVIVVHGGGFSTLYGHMEATSLQTGDRVAAGEVVGLMGSSGLSTGPHVHFELRRAGRPENPMPWLAPGP
ncbi:MAG: M23 family metallopeptidase [Candidatus Dormibacteraeota bacterium]|nr:M23 family metallopeptidase [Candidatus Dormibacteraeota bacterium]